MVVAERIELDFLAGEEEEWFAALRRAFVVAQGAAQSQQGLAEVVGCALLGQVRPEQAGERRATMGSAGAQRQVGEKSPNFVGPK
jgi:hypothetical protein